MKTFTLDQPMGVAALEEIHSVVALEAFSLRAVANRAADIIPNLSHAFKEVLSSQKTDKYDLKPLSVNFPVLNKALKGAKYLEVGEESIYVPQSFTGNLKEYLEVLLMALNFTNGIESRMVQFNQLVSAIMADRNTRQTTKDLSTATSAMETEREGVRKALEAFTKQGSRSDRAPLQNVYRSLNEVSECATIVIDVLDKANEVAITNVTKLTDDASELLQTLGEQANKGLLENMSNEIYRSLSSATLTMARDVELHGLLMFSVYQVKKSIEHTSELLIKTIRY